MSGAKGVVKNNAKTSGKSNSPNTSTQNAESKDIAQNKTHDKDKLQVNLICLYIYLFNLLLCVFKFVSYLCS